MSELYMSHLNSTIVQQLNEILQHHLSEWVSVYMEHQQRLNSSPRIVQFRTTTILTSLVILYTIYKLIFATNKRVRAIKFKLQAPEAAHKHWKGKRLFKSSVKDVENTDLIQCYCPATGQFLGAYASMDKSKIDELIESASDAQKKWSKTSFQTRIQLLVTLKEFIMKNQEIIARVACRDSGKTMLDALMGEILVTLEKLEWTIRYGKKTLQSSRRPGPTNFFMKFYKGAEVRYEPLGVVGAIISWNYPFHNLLGPIIASIFTGNGILVKCSEQVVWSSEYFIQIVKKSLEVCGHDSNLVQLCYCFPPSASDDTADYYSSHPGLKHITFIGSKPVAHHVLKAASKSLTPVVVELGGKDAFIVLDSSADLNVISSIIMRGTFQSAGQNCIGIERVIVSAKGYEKLVSILSSRIESLRLGSDIDNLEDVDMGAMISDNRFDYLEMLVKDAVRKGAKLLYGGVRYVHPNYPQGHYFNPTLLVDVTPDMKISKHEIFGPIIVVMKAQNTDDCIKIANSSPFGLGSSVFGSDIKECNYVANSLKTGNVAINDFGAFYMAQLPFGGLGGSGYGKFGGEEGLLSLCNAKSICFDVLPFFSTQIPRSIDYPIKNNRVAWEFSKSFITGAYTNSFLERIKSLISLIKNRK